MFAKQLIASQNQIGCNWGHLPEGPCETTFRNICEESSDALATVRLVCKNWQRISTQLITLVKCNGLQLRELCTFSHLRRIELECYSQVRLPEYAGATLNALSPLKELAITGLHKHEFSYLTALAQRTDLTYFSIKMVYFAQECIKLWELAALPTITHFAPAQPFVLNDTDAYLLEGHQLQHLAALTNLQSLTLQYIEDIGVEDLNWLRSHSITNLNFSQCRFNLERSTVFDFSTNLRRLSIEGCGYTLHSFDIKLRNLAQLNEIYYDNSLQIEEGFRQFSNFAQLERLTLDDVEISQDSLSVFQHLRNLKSIDLVIYDSVAYDILRQMSVLSQLTRINVEYVKYAVELPIDELAFESWKFCNKIQKLTLCGVQNFTPESTKNLTRFTILQELNLSNADQPIRRETLSCLQSLQQLTFNGTQIDDYNFNGASGLTNLEAFNIELNVNLSDQIFEVISTLTKLTHLKLHTGGVCFNDLTEINSTKSDQITERHLLRLTSLQKLQDLTLNSFRCFTGRSLKMLATLKELQKLNLAGCVNLQRGTFGAISAFQKLKVLNLTSTQIANEELARFSNLTNLREMHLAFCPNVTKTFVQESVHLKHLDTLKLLGVPEGYVDKDEEI